MPSDSHWIDPLTYLLVTPDLYLNSFRIKAPAESPSIISDGDFKLDALDIF